MSNRYSLAQTDSPRPTYRVIDRTYPSDEGGTFAVIMRVPDWAIPPLETALREDPRALNGPLALLLDHGGVSSRPWFVSPVSWDDVPTYAHPTRGEGSGEVPPLRPHQMPRWVDRYVTAVAHGTSPKRLLDVMNRRAASEAV